MKEMKDLKKMNDLKKMKDLKKMNDLIIVSFLNALTCNLNNLFDSFL